MQNVFLKYLVTLFISFSVCYSFSQNKLNIGIEGGLNYFNALINSSDIMRDVNLIVQHKNFELYGGITQTSVTEYSLKNTGYTVLGPVLGGKYHLFNTKRNSHFFIDINLQWRNYFLNPGTPPLGGKTAFSQYTLDNELLSEKIYTKNMHFSIGYESIIFGRFSIPITCGLGIANHKGNITELGILYEYFDSNYINQWEFSPFIKVAIRAYIKKLKTAANKS